MKKFIINVANLSYTNIYTNSEKVIKKIKEGRSITKTIPAIIIEDGDVSKIENYENTIVVLNDIIMNANIDVDINSALLLIKDEYFFFPDLVYLIIGMLANDLQKKGYYFVQSSVVNKNKKGVMLLGDPNAGKTTMAYSLVKNYGYNLVANDNVLVGIFDNKLKAICGTKNMQMRYGAIKQYFPEILDDLVINDNEKNEWNLKIYIDDYYKSKGYLYDDDVIISDIYNISTYKEGDTFINEREEIDKKLLIYEHLSKQIRSNRYVLVSMDYPLPSFEKKEYSKERYKMAVDICKATSIYDAKGTIKKLTKRIGEKNE